MKKKEFCILNKQYSEEEYWKTVDDIKVKMLERGEYGEYFPTTMSTSYVPECGAVLYAGASDDALKKLGGNVFDPHADGAIPQNTQDQSKQRSAGDVPDSIDDLTDDWVGVPIYDQEMNRTFSILKPEAEYYRRERIAPPDRHFILRMKNLSHVGQKAQLEYRACIVCSKRILTSVNIRYPKRRTYCTQCYLAYLEKNG